MKTYITLFAFVALPFTGLSAQSKYCDKLIQNGDTVVCQDFGHKGKVFREHFYVKGKREFTRWWHYRKNGEYQFIQHKKKSVFAKKHGPAMQFYPDGKVKLYVFYQNGIRTGKCYSYYPSGKMKSACNSNDKGRPDGLLTEFYENGQVMNQARWIDGLIVEVLVNKDEQGYDVPFGTLLYGTGTWLYREPGTNNVWVHHYQDGKLIKTTKVQNQ
ncbi:MAG: hypothetical protein JNN28_04505 [Saprospiraceae bacterium]|nr:hypothetical protein [Saprospiraceae bacterium]